MRPFSGSEIRSTELYAPDNLIQHTDNDVTTLNTSQFKLGLPGVNHKFRGKKQSLFFGKPIGQIGGLPAIWDFKTNPRPIHVGTHISQIIDT